MKTIEDVQSAFACAVNSLVPPGYRAVVALRVDGRDRPIRRDASEKYWNPVSGSVEITFAKIDPENKPAPAKATPPPAMPQLPTPLLEAVRALDAAERRVSFVAIKWFRDQFLPSAGVSWATAPFAGQEVVKDAIDRGIFLTSKVPNPKSPAYPTTAIRLNRQLPEVQAALGETGTASARTFRPVGISGETLSSTIIRDRR